MYIHVCNNTCIYVITMCIIVIYCIHYIYIYMYIIIYITRIIKNIFKNERVCSIKTEKAQEQDGFGNKMKYHFHITTIHKYHFFVFCLYSSCVYLCRVVMWKWYFICCQSHLVPVPIWF